MNKVLDLLGRVAKAVAAAVLPLVIVSLEQSSFNWKAILAGALTAVGVFLIPNKKAA